MDWVALALFQLLVLSGACQPAKSQCCKALSVHDYPGWCGGPARFGEGQGTGPAKMRGQREEMREEILEKCIKTMLRAQLWLWTEDWQESEIALFKVGAVRTFSSLKLKSILLSFQPGS